MIFKKVKSSKTKAKAGSIRDLTDYIRDPGNPKEKVLYENGRGFICDDHKSQQSEMIALASETVRSKNPVSHYMMSWKEDELPNPKQVEEAVDILLKELGLSDHQTIYGLHKDTDNIHLHIAINRVHPETLKVIKPNKGFDIEAGHRAIAKIEHLQGWQPEKRSRYQVLENGELVRGHIDPNRPRQPEQRRKDMEHRTGEKSAERIAIEEAAPIILKAKSWEELHQRLNERGMRYERKGSGALVWIGDVAVKASSADRKASLSAVQKRLGEYQPGREQQEKEKQAPQPIKQNAPGWQSYIEARKAHYAEKERAKIEQQNRHDAERQKLREEQRARREKVLTGIIGGDGLNALRSVLAAEQAAAKAELKERQQREREVLRKKHPRFRDYEEWLREKSPEQAHQWRYRMSEPDGIRGESKEELKPRDIRAFEAEVRPDGVHYFRPEATKEGWGASFVDRGRKIEIYDAQDRDSVLAALQLGAQKFGKFEVYGTEEYKATCVQLAAEHGFTITNPELQKVIKKEQQRIQEERTQARKAQELKEFERYHAAVGAERYRVTAIKMRQDGSKQTFILDKQEGVTRGFAPQEIARRTPEMQRLQRRGENLYYTPLSEKKHHLLIDDMNREKLECFIKDGYRPAVLLESSPGNYQAILTIPKLGTPHDKDVGNRLAEQLNRKYGDPDLSGCIHPHRAPGYENRKPKHQREDGSYPQVNLLKAEQRECAKALDLSREIDGEYQRQAEKKAREPERKNTLEIPVPSAADAISAYQVHYRDVQRRQKGQRNEVDLSRVDSMIAVRMRMTGHSQAEIEGALRQCAPKIREEAESRDWDDYAKRTARFAFGMGGDRQVEQLTRYRDSWLRLEQQAKEREAKEVVGRGTLTEVVEQAQKRFPDTVFVEANWKKESRAWVITPEQLIGIDKHLNKAREAYNVASRSSYNLTGNGTIRNEQTGKDEFIAISRKSMEKLPAELKKAVERHFNPEPERSRGRGYGMSR